MPKETKKVPWTVIAVGLFLVVFFGTALLLFSPRKGAPQAPAAVGNEAPPRAAEPDEYLRNPAPLPSPAEAPQTSPGEVVVVYGENPPASALPGAAVPEGTVPPSSEASPVPSAPAAANPAALPAPAKSGTYTPAPSTPKAKPAAAPKSPAAATAPKSKTVTVAEWWIQASSPTSRARAEGLQEDLARQGLSSVITLKDVDGITHYRVRIGPYTTEKEALGWRDKIRSIPDCSEAYVSKTFVQRTQ